MTWGPFSAEAVTLDGELQKLHKEGRVSDALNAIKAALDKAHRVGPSNISYAEFEAACEARASAGER